MRTPTEMGPARAGGAGGGGGGPTRVAEWELKAKAGRRLWMGCGARAAALLLSPWSCMRTLMRSSGWVEQPATMEAMPPSTKPLTPISSSENQRSNFCSSGLLEN
ncbi:hypothetical protein ACE6H2_005257 [Prunus campanulata]